MYFITVMEDRKDPFDNKACSRCWGYYYNFRDAFDVVINNKTDMWETIYDYVVIEEIPEGTVQHAIDLKWFKYNKKENKYCACEKPDWSNKLCNFAIG